MAEPIEMPFWNVDSGGPKELCNRWGVQIGRELLRGMNLGFSRTPPSTVPTGCDIGISLHAVKQRSEWLDTEALKCHIKFSQ